MSDPYWFDLDKHTGSQACMIGTYFEEDSEEDDGTVHVLGRVMPRDRGWTWLVEDHYVGPVGSGWTETEAEAKADCQKCADWWCADEVDTDDWRTFERAE